MRTVWTLAALSLAAVAMSALPATATAEPAPTEVSAATPLDAFRSVLPIVGDGSCPPLPGGLFWP